MSALRAASMTYLPVGNPLPKTPTDSSTFSNVPRRRLSNVQHISLRLRGASGAEGAELYQSGG
jgi:hypothetical protein